MQIPGSCTFDGRRWAIDDWQGNHGCVPSDEDLGIETISPATNNWAGRVDHFAVVQGRLYLFKVEVSLAPDFDRARIGGRRMPAGHSGMPASTGVQSWVSYPAL